MFPAFKSQYAVLNAACLILCGFASSVIGGIICDRYEKKTYMAKSMVVIAGNIISVPLFAAICFSGNFYFAILALALAILFSGSYLAPAITMMQSSTSPQNTGLVVSAYSFFSYIGQTLSPLLFNFLAQ